jgi:hypothetical protein
MFRLGVILFALALLFMLTAVAFRATDQLGHPYRVAAALAATLVVSLALLLDW